MKYYLVKTIINWADEFDCYGLELFTIEELNNSIKFLEDNKDTEVCLYFGSNQGWDDITWSSLKNDIEIIEISQEEYNVLKKLNLDNFGNINLISDILDCIYIKTLR